MKAVGIDGCRFGWITACYDDGQVLLFATINDVIARYGNNDLFLIDMPLGLASANCTNRTCEKEARTVLPGNRKSSIFPVPCREALSSADYAEASEINQKISGKKLSKQSWFILPKIRELDDLLIGNHQTRKKIRESHPEISFQFLNNEIPLLHSKKTAEGIAERLAILMKHNNQSAKIFENALTDYKRFQVAKDDILDAMCLALTLTFMIAEPEDEWSKSSFRSNPLTDEQGIEMAIYYYAAKRRMM